MAKKQEESFAVVEKFARTITPLPIEREHQGVGGMMVWGDNNLYPNFLQKLYDTVPLHQSIVNSKRDYIIADGLVNKADGTPFTGSICPKDTPTVFVQKVALDWVFYQCLAIKVQYNIFGKPILISHVPVGDLRTNRSFTKFWVCEDWEQFSGQELSYPAYKLGVSATRETAIFFYKKYAPSTSKVYPSIAYNSAITNMVTESLINEFNKNSLEDGFSAAHIISFFKGMPDSVAGKEFTDKVKAAYSGVKGAKYIIDFNNPKTAQSGDNSIKVETVDSPDYSAKLEGVNKKNETNILSAHQAPSRALFGIEQAAGLNGNDLENAYQIFKKVWVKVNRNDVEDGLNVVFTALGYGLVEFKDSGTILNKTLADATKEKVYTIDELRAVDGLAPLPNGAGEVCLTPVPTNQTTINAPGFTPAGQGEGGTGFTPKAGFTPRSGFTPLRKGFGSYEIGKPIVPKVRRLTDQDFEAVKELGASRGDYSLLGESDVDPSTPENFRLIELKFDDQTDVDKWLTDNNITDMSTAEIRGAIKKDLSINLTSKELEAQIQVLKDAGVLENKEAEKKSLTRDVQVMYEYDVRPGFGEAIIQTSRGFCKKLIANDRYYSRADIQQMSAIFGYDVFTHCGGWYHNPTTNEDENQCRHYFKSVRVLKKQTND